MKKNFVITKITMSSLFLLPSLTVSPVIAADSATVNITATVQASCSLSVSTKTVNLGPIPASEFTATTGTNLTSYSGSFTVTPQCLGGDNYKLSLTPSSAAGSCIGTNRDFVAFCISAPNGDVDFTGGQTAFYTGNIAGGGVTMNVTPQVRSGVITGGLVEDSSVTITIEAL